MKRPKTQRQGDLLFIPIAPVASAQPHHDGRILARGEATGHSHAIIAEDLSHCDVYLDATGRLIVTVKPKKRVRVGHEEHGPVELQAGTYEVRRQREFEPRGWRHVAD